VTDVEIMSVQINVKLTC